MVVDADDSVVTQDSKGSIVSFFVGKPGHGRRLSVESAPQSQLPRLPHWFCSRFVMSLHLMTLFTAHPAKLINLLALLFAFPGGWLLHATRRRELRAMASLQTQRQSRANEEPMLDWATLRMNRFFYCFGFACMGLALLVSWISTQV
jgi:hypothetical protein